MKPITEEEACSILEKARIPLSETVRKSWDACAKKTSDTLNLLLELCELGETCSPGHSKPAVKKRFLEIGKHASALQKLINETDPFTLARMGYDKKVLLDLAERNGSLADAAYKALDRLSGAWFFNERRPPERVRKASLLMLMQLYLELTNRKPGLSKDKEGHSPSGPFLRFSYLCLERIGLRTDEAALAKAIRQIRKELKTPSPEVLALYSALLERC